METKVMVMNVIRSSVEEWFDEVEKNIQNETDKFSIHVKLGLLKHDDYSDNNDFSAPFGEQYFSAGVYEKLSKSKEEKERELFKDYWTWSPLFAFDILLSRYEQIEKVVFINSGYWEFSCTLERRKGDEPWLNMTAYSCEGSKLSYVKEYIPFFLEEIETLVECKPPLLRDQTLTETLAKNNPNIETFLCRWDFVSKEVLSTPYKNFLVDTKYAKKYEKLDNELKGVDDAEKFILFRLFLTEQEVEFKPKVETILAFLRSGIAPVRVQALNLFHKHYSQTIQTVDSLNIWLSGSLKAYKNSQVKEMLAEKNATLTTKKTTKTELLVVGLKAKIEELPTDISVISAVGLEEMLSQSEERLLASNENKNIAEKLENLLVSEDDSNVTLALNLMEEGGIPNEVFEIVAGFFKVHPSKKIRDKAKELIVRHGGVKGEEFLAICGRRNYLSMGDDEKPKKDLLALEKIEGFDVERFAYILVMQRDIAKFYLMTKESVWAKKAIEEHINKTAYGWVTIDGEASSHLKLATKIDRIYTNVYSEVFEEMPWLKTLNIENKKENIVLSREMILNLKSIQSLVITAKVIRLEGSISLDEVDLEASSIVVLGNLTAKNELNIKTKKLEVASLQSNHLTLQSVNKINENIEVVGSPKKLEIINCNFSQEVYKKLFLKSLVEVNIEVNQKFILDDCVKNLNTKLFNLEAKSILIVGEKATLKSAEMYLKTGRMVCKEEWRHQIKSLELASLHLSENILNEFIEKLTMRYDYYDYYNNQEKEFFIPSFLSKYTNLKKLELEHFSGTELPIIFESYAPFSIKTFSLKNLKLILTEKLPMPKLETLMLDDVDIDEATKKHLMIGSLQKIGYSQYKGVFDFDISNMKNLYELEFFMNEVENKVYPIKKLTILDDEMKFCTPHNFPNVEILNRRHDESKGFSSFIGFKHLKRVEAGSSNYHKFDDIEKLEQLEELKFYASNIGYGGHKEFSLPCFKKPLKIKKVEFSLLHLEYTKPNYEYFSNLEELVLDDVLINDYAVFKMPSLKRVTVLNQPSVNCPKNWLEDLKSYFSEQEVIEGEIK